MADKSAATELDHASSRKIAQERNDAANFMEGPAYDVRQGTPITEKTPVQPYKDAVQEREPTGTGRSDQSAPFTIKGA
jgi:hypothetical protein